MLKASLKFPKSFDSFSELLIYIKALKLRLKNVNRNFSKNRKTTQFHIKSTTFLTFHHATKKKGKLRGNEVHYERL